MELKQKKYYDYPLCKECEVGRVINDTCDYCGAVYTDTYKIIDAMITCGGSFVSNLGRLWKLADSTNKAILEDAFKHYFEKYKHFNKLGDE